VNAPRVPRIRLATNAANQATSLAIARTLLLRVLDEAVEDFNLVGVDLRSATSAPRLATSLVTALRLVDTVEVDTVVNKVDTAVVSVADEEVVDKLATHAVAMDTCLVTALKARSATTVAKLVISPETAPPRPHPSEPATSASSPVTSRLNALTRFTTMITKKTESETITRETKKQHLTLRTNPGHFEGWLVADLRISTNETT